MGFAKKEKQGSSNMFIASQVSKKTGNVAAWINITDTLARQVFGVMKASEVTAQQASEVLPTMFENEFVEVRITDTTAELEPIAATDF